MHIAICSAREAVDSRTQVYVQHRVSDTLRSVEREIRNVTVCLSDQPVDLPRLVICTIALEFITGERVTANATAEWPYAAVDTAMRRVWTHVGDRAHHNRRIREDAAETSGAT